MPSRLLAADRAAGSSIRCLGSWQPRGTHPLTERAAIAEAVHDLRRPVAFVQTDAGLALADGGICTLGEAPTGEALPLVGFAAAQPLDQLGDPAFSHAHGLRLPYVTGAMANGIGSCEIVEAMGRAGMLGFFGAAGLSVGRVEAAIARLQQSLGDTPFGFNLIHSPNEPELETAVVERYLRAGIRLVEASAYLDLTPQVVRYRVSGIHTDSTGQIVAPNRVVAKVSRVEVASKFFAPPPERILRELVQQGHITTQEATLASGLPMAADVTAEADSGGHTDNRPAISLIPTMIALRDRMQEQYGFAEPLRVGAAGGIATPQSAAAAFAMGAAYVVTGSINQACVESGSSDPVRRMLAEAGQADVIMAPAADMFEIGVKVQVLKRGTMFAMRAAKLFEVYRACASLEAIPPAERANLEKTIFRTSLDDIWQQTEDFFRQRDPTQLTRAVADPKYRMALVFRWYLGLASRWANAGEPTRQMDYQVWCGPAMGAFNEWAKGTFLEPVAARDVVTVGLNLLYGAGVALRLASLRGQGVRLGAAVERIVPQTREWLAERIG